MIADHSYACAIDLFRTSDLFLRECHCTTNRTPDKAPSEVRHFRIKEMVMPSSHFLLRDGGLPIRLWRQSEVMWHVDFGNPRDVIRGTLHRPKWFERRMYRQPEWYGVDTLILKDPSYLVPLLVPAQIVRSSLLLTIRDRGGPLWTNWKDSFLYISQYLGPLQEVQPRDGLLDAFAWLATSQKGSMRQFLDRVHSVITAEGWSLAAKPEGGICSASDLEEANQM